MSAAPKLSRRQLFGLGEPRRAEAPVAPPAPTFSLAAFYRGRGASASPRPVARRRLRIVPSRCLAERSFCTVCSERCPIEGAIRVELGRPSIVDAACDGCGACLRVCPAPVLAIELVGGAQ